jgi:hypothetical protein
VWTPRATRCWSGDRECPGGCCARGYTARVPDRCEGRDAGGSRTTVALGTVALGTGHWALGTGHWALGTGHWGLGTGESGVGSRDSALGGRRGAVGSRGRRGAVGADALSGEHFALGRWGVGRLDARLRGLPDVHAEPPCALSLTDHAVVFRTQGKVSRAHGNDPTGRVLLFGPVETASDDLASGIRALASGTGPRLRPLPRRTGTPRRGIPVSTDSPSEPTAGAQRRSTVTAKGGHHRLAEPARGCGRDCRRRSKSGPL